MYVSVASKSSRAAGYYRVQLGRTMNALVRRHGLGGDKTVPDHAFSKLRWDCDNAGHRR